MMGSLSADSQCTAIRDVWSCDSLEKAEAFIKTYGSQTTLELENFVANSFRPSSQHLETVNPKTGNVFAKVPISSAEEVDRALQEASTAFKSWSKTTAAARSQYLQRVAQLIQENRELFAIWESIDQGKTLARARVEVDRAISNFRSVNAIRL